ncbi:hypothetical protein [Enterobacter ludwigii]|jgi:hypothetical protein|uniref:Lysozyme inhibitor LprI N-terminal domain-containing protein n=1 Tax=Enterobacter ludwigii TaxID=299767 RepID=A0AAX3L6R6_9ENTR|nr:hypothetical protein [Enterobacter ludwigii]EKS7108305.1 hypothetical protein [Enterobacter ludwigii]ELN9420500.1 hypothetical protein [Enterobacter ludwigii]KUQ47899.1 hypothetical protein AWI16_23875 [Enterobacter ludwigii]MBX8912839.1 hypothetical protein [Enterobacter ludwigii]MCM7780655.1 hypothetical protein [Enterobacter ludwigii]
MKIKCLLLILFASYSTAGFAAFSEAENNQLASINQKSSGEVKSALDNLNKSIDEQIDNNIERKSLILDLKNSWGQMINKKCQLETIESKGTDAEMAEMNNCLIKNYQEEMKYFDAMLP